MLILAIKRCQHLYNDFIYIRRRLIWERNLIYIDRHNFEALNGGYSHFVKMNKFGDLTNAEFRALYNGFNRTKNMQKQPSHKVFQKPDGLKVPDSVGNLQYQ